MCYFVYILYSTSLDRYYIGYTTDLGVRLSYHNNPIESRKFTAKGVPWILKVSIAVSNLRHARALEHYLKRMKSRIFLEKFISDQHLREDLKAKTAPDC
jgi:putative endonuclease